MRNQASDLSDDVPQTLFSRRRGPAAEPEEQEDEVPIQRPRLRRRARADAGDRESLKRLLQDVPNFGKLLWRLYRDPRVSRLDKGLVLVAIAYLVSPKDLIPEDKMPAWLPLLGQVDDIYVLALALDRLLNNAGVDVLLDHWDGDVASLEMAISALDRAGSFLPEGVRTLLHQRGRATG